MDSGTWRFEVLVFVRVRTRTKSVMALREVWMWLDENPLNLPVRSSTSAQLVNEIVIRLQARTRRFLRQGFQNGLQLLVHKPPN